MPCEILFSPPSQASKTRQAGVPRVLEETPRHWLLPNTSVCAGEAVRGEFPPNLWLQIEMTTPGEQQALLQVLTLCPGGCCKSLCLAALLPVQPTYGTTTLESEGSPKTLI